MCALLIEDPDDVRQLIENAVAWRMFGLAFERPRSGWRNHVASIANDSHDENVRTVALLAKERASEQRFLCVLGPGGAVSPREAAYRGYADPGQLLSELEAIYSAFAYEPKSEECPDRVSVEAGFVGYLRMKQAFARIVGDGESERVAADAVDMFLVEHLAPVAVGLCKRFEDGDSLYVARAARLMRERSGAVDARVEEEPAEDDGEMNCSGCPT